MSRRNRNNYLSIAAVRTIGLDFIEMLEETNRRSISDRNTLTDIYNTEFRDRDGGVKDPNFSRVLYALRNANKARLSRTGRVYFNTNVRTGLHDQWFRPRRRQQNQANATPGNVSSVTPSSDQGPSCPESGVRARRKLVKYILQRLNTTDRSHFIADKWGVRVSSELYIEDGKIRISVDEAEVYELKLFVENTGQEAVYFTYYTALCWLQYFTLEDSRKVTRNNPLRLEPREKYEVIVRFKSSHVGVYSATLAFEFKKNTQPTTRSFHIVRFIEAEYRSKLAALLGPTEPYKPLRLNISEPENCIIDEGFPPDGYVQNFLVNVLPLGKYIHPPDTTILAELLKEDCSSRIFRGKLKDLQLVKVYFIIKWPFSIYKSSKVTTPVFMIT